MPRATKTVGNAASNPTAVSEDEIHSVTPLRRGRSATRAASLLHPAAVSTIVSTLPIPLEPVQEQSLPEVDLLPLKQRRPIKKTVALAATLLDSQEQEHEVPASTPYAPGRRGRSAVKSTLLISTVSGHVAFNPKRPSEAAAMDLHSGSIQEETIGCSPIMQSASRELKNAVSISKTPQTNCDGVAMVISPTSSGSTSTHADVIDLTTGGSPLTTKTTTIQDQILDSSPAAITATVDSPRLETASRAMCDPSSTLSDPTASDAIVITPLSHSTAIAISPSCSHLEQRKTAMKELAYDIERTFYETTHMPVMHEEGPVVTKEKDRSHDPLADLLKRIQRPLSSSVDPEPILLDTPIRVNTSIPAISSSSANPTVLGQADTETKMADLMPSTEHRSILSQNSLGYVDDEDDCEVIDLEEFQKASVAALGAPTRSKPLSNAYQPHRILQTSDILANTYTPIAACSSTTHPLLLSNGLGSSTRNMGLDRSGVLSSMSSMSLGSQLAVSNQDPASSKGSSNNSNSISSDINQSISQPLVQLHAGDLPNRPAPDHDSDDIDDINNDKENDKDKWETELMRWQTSMKKAVRKEEGWLKKTIEFRPPDEIIERSIDEQIKGLQLQYGNKGTPKGMTITLMPHQVYGLAWLISMEEGEIKGGILADDTIQMLALIVHRYQPPTRERGGTLIVTPLALINQWEREITTKSNMGLKVYVHHGPLRHRSKNALRQYDIVITTYAVLTGEAPKPSQSVNGVVIPASKGGPLFRAKWHRVALDEAQMIKNKDTRASLACLELSSMSRFSMTGTPIQNSADEVFSQLRFLRIPHWSVYQHFHDCITRNIKRDNMESSRVAVNRLQVVLRSCMLRRTKTSIDSFGEPLVKLPLRLVEVQQVVLKREEMAFYRAVETCATRQFNEYVEKGTVLRNYSNILGLLLRLRQAATHPHLVREAFFDAERGNFSLGFMNSGIPIAATTSARIEKEGTEKDVYDMRGPLQRSQTAPTNFMGPSGSAIDSKGKGKAKSSEIRDFEAELYASDEDESLDEARRQFLPLVFERVLSEARSDLQLFIGQECPMCIDVMMDPCITSCGHRFCRECISEFLYSQTFDKEEDATVKHCPICRADIIIGPYSLVSASVIVAKIMAENQKRMSIDELHSVHEHQGGRLLVQSTDQPTSPVDIRDVLFGLHPDGDWSSWISSGKLDMIVKVLEQTREEDPAYKTVIFSQWATNLDLIQTALLKQGFRLSRYDGSMDTASRDEAVKKLFEDQLTTVILVSLKCGGVGLNLTVACRVIICDLWWNPAVEDQAIDRVHRIGQRMDVRVSRLVTKDTIEERILAMQGDKRQIIAGVLGEGEFKLGRLSVKDLLFLFKEGNSIRSNEAGDVEIYSDAQDDSRYIHDNSIDHEDNIDERNTTIEDNTPLGELSLG
ncbi:hypothetical protein BASA84_000130 [Batrachochytrium salamandrivorans]|nr:hypothetical protein BASA84_000130 [Batrachochytrium salamandrivorans]